jgi:hypothetical protein
MLFHTISGNENHELDSVELYLAQTETKVPTYLILKYEHFQF